MNIPLKPIPISLLVGFTATPVWAQSIQGSPGYWHYGWGWGHMAFGGLMMIAFWGGIIVLAVLAVRWFGRDTGTQPKPPEKSAIDILNERFARGEIDNDEYEDRKRFLLN